MASTNAMKSVLLFAFLCFFISVCRADAVDDLATTARENIFKIVDGSLKDGGDAAHCTKDKIVVRKEWGNLTIPERDDYIAAVKCLMDKPSTNTDKLSRYDDFVAVHINMTYMVHGTANFLGWHRLLLHSYESALKNECNYKGTQPYWNWAKYKDIANSPIFNGDDHSLGGNGDYVQHGNHNVAGLSIPTGKGGGCVTTGPFKDMKLKLGPIALTYSVTGIPANPRQDGLGYNPRCLRRDVNDYFITRGLTVDQILGHLTGPQAIGPFQDKVQGVDGGTWGVHSAGHYTYIGDPAGDLFTSPGDPAFWLHHGMIDRLWWTWQNYKDPSTRTYSIAGGTRMFATSEPGKMTDVVDVGIVSAANAPTYQLKDMMSSVSGPYCYVYE